MKKFKYAKHLGKKPTKTALNNPQNGEHLNTFGSVVGFNVVLVVTMKV